MINMNILSQVMPGLEAIDFQAKPTFGRKMTEVFQEVIDYRDNLNYSKVDDNVDAHRRYRIDQVNKFCRNTMSDKLRKVVKAELGLDVKKIFMFGGEYDGINGFFAVTVDFDDWKAALDLESRMTASGFGDQFSSDPDRVEEMTHMADNLDLHNAKLTKSTFGKNRKIYCSMYFDINTAFLVEDFYPTGFAKAMSAEEVAAIMMHECGHMLTIIEHSADLYFTYGRAMTKVNKLASDPNHNFKAILDTASVELIPAIKKLVNLCNTDSVMYASAKRIGNTLVAAIEGLRKLYGNESQNTENESWVYTIGSFVGNIICLAIYTIFYAFFILCFFVMGGVLIYECMKLGYVDEKPNGEKSADIKANYNNTFLLERWADEFVARQGYGEYLASSLNKLNDYFTYGNLGTVTSYRLRNSTIFNAICVCYGWVLDKVSPLAYLEPVGYEGQFKRIKRVLQNTYGFFTDEHVNKDIQRVWLKNVKRLEEEMDRAKTVSDTAMGQAFYQILKDLTNPFQWYQLIKNGGLDRDYSILQDRLDDLSKNSLNALAAKLKTRA